LTVHLLLRCTDQARLYGKITMQCSIVKDQRARPRRHHGTGIRFTPNASALAPPCAKWWR